MARWSAALAADLSVRHTKGLSAETFAVPTRERFKAALEALTSELPESYIAMLKAHHAAPEHTATAGQLAEAIGYRSYSPVNLHYGTLARRLGDAMAQSTGDFIPLKLLVEFVMPGERDNDEILWIMRPELVGALEDLGWVAKGV